MKKRKKHILLQLFLSTFYLSAFTFGGGYVIITLLKNKFVDDYHWIDEEEMLDMVAIAQSSPGPIAVNGAIVVGYKLAGIPGVCFSVLGSVLPPMLILSAVSLFYDTFSTNPCIASVLSGMKAGVGAVIASVVYDMGKSIIKTKDVMNICIMAISFCLCYFGNVNVVCVILAVALFGIFSSAWKTRHQP